MPTCMLRDGAELVYADEGMGEPVLLLHGWAANHTFFDDLSRRLAVSRRVIAPTLRAHPGSQSGSAPLTITTLGDDIVQLVEAMDLKNITAVGWSMGAMVLWEAAPHLGSRLTNLIIEDMAPRLTSDESWRHSLAGNYRAADVAATVAEIETNWPAHVARFVPLMFAPGMERPDLLRWTADQVLMASPAAMAALWSSMAAQDFRAAIANIAQPMLVIHGRDSQVHSLDATAFVARAAPHGAHAVIEKAGHAVHLEAAEEFLKHVSAFACAEWQPKSRSGGIS